MADSVIAALFDADPPSNNGWIGNVVVEDPASKYAPNAIGPAAAMKVVPKYKPLLLMYKFAVNPVTRSRKV
jgi:hypothetical protein